MSDNVMIDYYRCAERYSASLPFEANDVIDNLRLERYTSVRSTSGFAWQLVRQIYYAMRPVLGVAFRKHLQRAYLNGWEDITFPHWPLDRTVDRLFEAMAVSSLDSRGETEMPFVWFWPERRSGCVILTHDIETAAGRDFAPTLADIDASFGFKSSFQIVPEERYEVTESFLESLRGKECEINLHGDNHDGHLFDDHGTFVERARKINRYARQYGVAGFRSPVLYRNLDWYGDFEFSYDMSVPNCGNLDPQRGGCCTVMPYFIGGVVELPLTMAQDYTLFHLLHENSIDLWKRQIDMVLETNGLISFNVHPDYIIEQPYRDLYCKLLDHLANVCAERNVWRALPKEVNDWWRQRRESGVINARALLEKGRLTYEIAEANSRRHDYALVV